MKLLVFHNPDAGHDELPRHVLIDQLQRARHEVVWIESGAAELSEVLACPFDAVVVAGGDGSVGAVGRELLGRRIPIAVLPVGTANNIASLVGATTGNLIERLQQGVSRPFDVGVVDGAGEPKRFLEGVGFGAFAEAADILSVHGDGPLAAVGREEELERDRQMLRACVRRTQPSEYRLDVDGAEVTGTWLLVEVTNAGLIGPNLRLSADAVPADGLLDVVTVDVSEREALLAFIAVDQRLPSSRPPFTVHRARRVRLRAPAGRIFHVDGETLTPARPVDLRIGIEPAALEFLVPSGPDSL